MKGVCGGVAICS